MKRITKSVTALFMVLVVCSLSIINAFAANDPVQNVSYSYSETGNCTVDYGGIVYVSNSYNCTHRFTVNGRIATCTWSLNSTPSKGTYNNATKYYLAKSAMRAKAFYWLYLAPNTKIASANAKYDQSSTTYADDIANALASCSSTGDYAFIHSVIDYLQQGQLNEYNDATWNKVVKVFAAKAQYYPDVPAEYNIFYFYPEGKASQSLMSWEEAAHGYIKVIKKSSVPALTDGNALYSLSGAEFTVYKSRIDAEQKANPFMTLATDENGVSTVSEIDLGSYYVRETKAPTGFELSDEIKELVIDAIREEPYVVEFEDKPIAASLSVLLKKRNATSGTHSQADVSGAEYTVSYYTGFFDEETIGSVAPARTWVLSVDKNGMCRYDAEHFVSGDALYTDGSGNNVLPLGTVKIKETKAPDGFYLDDTIFVRQITAETAADVTRYNVPVSDEYEIPYLTFSGEKKWADDNDRDGKRPKSVTIELYRDRALIDTAVVSKETDWKYEFINLPKAYVDMSLEEHVHNYTYEVREGAVEYYTSKSTGAVTDPEDESHLICDFTNHYKPAKISVGGTKSWDDFDNRLGLRPQTIKVILNRDGKKYSEVTTSEAENWTYSFKDLYKYHDGGKEYVYTVTEEPVPGYTLTVDGYNTKNTLKSGSVTLNKADRRNKPMEGVTFKLFTENGKPVKSSSNGIKYKYSGLSDKEDDAVYTTNADGQIIVENLPCGKYYFLEIKTADGYMPYGDKLHFEIDGETDASLNVTLDVKNEKAVMPETGGCGNVLFGLLSAVLAAFGAVLLYTTTKTSKKKG
ncbi:MAG: Cna B-type domain-containing protein [Ruminococcus sp.]|nr:Cna B-type domain-containing protein [Ruminococcus sp.]